MDINEPQITVLIVNYNTADFIEASLYALDRLNEYPYKVLVCDNGSKGKDKSKFRKLTERYSNVELFFRQQSRYGSEGHGEALDFLIPKVKTKHTLILDADCILLHEGWDKILINELDDKVKIIGTPPIKEQGIKPTDFPLMYVVLFETQTFFKLGISMKPNVGANEEGADTGHQMREKYLSAGYKASLLNSRNTRFDRSGPFGNITLCTEYYLSDYKDIFACHFSRGSTLGAAKYKSPVYNIPVFGNFIRFIKGSIDKKKWLLKCHNIIEGIYHEDRVCSI